MGRGASKRHSSFIPESSRLAGVLAAVLDEEDKSHTSGWQSSEHLWCYSTCLEFALSTSFTREICFCFLCQPFMGL